MIWSGVVWWVLAVVTAFGMLAAMLVLVVLLIRSSSRSKGSDPDQTKKVS